MHEMQRPIRLPKCQSHMRSGKLATAIAGNNANDVAAPQFPFDGRDATLWNLIQWAARNAGLHLPQWPKQCAIRRQVPVMPPAHRHLARRVRYAHTSQAASEVFDEAAPVIVRKPILQIMEPRKVFARALASAIAIQLDVMEQPFRRPILFGVIEHPRESE